MSYKLFVISHDFNKVIDNHTLTPLVCGNPYNKNYSSTLQDSVGDNISSLNKTYNELTGIYWVYKHINDFENSEYIGFEHYRRFFCFDGSTKHLFVKKNVSPRIFPKNNCVENYFQNYDFVIPYLSKYKSVRKHYEKSHNKNDLDLVAKIIKNKFPDYTDSLEDYLSSKKEYLYNMFILKKEDFIRYCQFIFPILEEFNLTNNDDDRLYISERITGVFFTKLTKENKRPLFLPILLVNKKSLKLSLKQCHNNFCDHKNKGFLFKLKPLWLFFMPRWFEQYLRRRKTK